MTSLGTKIFIKFFCKAMGKDQFGNCYYQTKQKDGSGKFKRIVMYNGIEDASKIPALWHAWLHYTIDELPQNQLHYNWEKIHVPNLTGTDWSYLPSGCKNSLTNGIRRKTTGDYQAWKPSN